MTQIITILSLIFSVTLTSCTKNSSESIPGKISGVISISPELAAKLKPDSDVLYIIARAQQAGPPSAVKRIMNPQFPLKYIIGPEDSMMPNAPGFANGDTLTLTARLSRSGNAMPAPGDLEGVYKKNPASLGTSEIDITIEQERK